MDVRFDPLWAPDRAAITRRPFNTPEEVVARALETLAGEEPARSEEKDQRQAVQEVLAFAGKHRFTIGEGFASETRSTMGISIDRALRPGPLSDIELVFSRTPYSLDIRAHSKRATPSSLLYGRSRLPRHSQRRNAIDASHRMGWRHF